MPSKSTTNKAKKSAQSLALDKLAASGLDLKDAKELKMQVLDISKTAKLGFDALPSLKINYYSPKGKPMGDWAKAPPFYRLRYLDVANDFDQITTKKNQRYTQPLNTACCAYFPQNMADWPTILKDPNEPLIITEGELKAACACKAGFPTIGLGGVYNWRSLPKGVGMLPELQSVVWLRRNVYICFDSDYLTNPMVCAALRTLAEELTDLGAYAHVVTLPAIAKEGKTGLDDFIVSEGAKSLEPVLKEAEPIGLIKPLFDFNDHYIYIQDPGLVLNQGSQAKISPGAFKEHLEAAKSYQARELKPDGTISHRRVSAAAAWLSWPLRKQAKGLTYMPGQEKFIQDEGMYNTWPGWGCEPRKGPVKPFLDLIDHIFTGADDADKRWFLQWCAYPIQNPGVKLFTSAVLHGVRHGTGKSLLGYSLGRIYGKNFSEISQADLHGSFNDWAEARQFILGDDVTGSNKRADADLLKKLITQKEIRINIKYVPSYSVPDCINYLFTSNHPDAFFLEDDDRRFFIHEILVGPLGEMFYRKYMQWLDDKGARYLFAYLKAFNTKSFNPAAPALRTAAKSRMIADIQSDLGGWVRQLLAVPNNVLKVGEIALKQDIYTNKELLQIYDPLGRTGTTANGLGRELKRAGVPQAVQGVPIRLPDGSQARYYIIRNKDKWLKAGVGGCAKHLTDCVPAQNNRKGKY